MDRLTLTVSARTLDPNTPIVIGVGQHAERVDDVVGYEALSAVELACRAAARALADTGTDPRLLAAAVEVAAGIRQFEISGPRSRAPLGKSDNYPRSVAAGVGADPARAILEVSGGQGPQHLVTEMAASIASGQTQVAMLFGSEAISTVRHLSSTAAPPDFAETVGGQLEDRGYGLDGIASESLVRAGVLTPSVLYALFENARRARLGLGRAAYATSMGELFEPFSQVAAANSYAAAPTARTAEELVTPTQRNRPIADPYCRFVVSRDQVNQAAAVVLSSVQRARELGVPEDRWVYLHGHADLRDREVMDRADLSNSPAAVMAVEHALSVAGIADTQLGFIDLYSCFPIAVFAVADSFGWAADDPRKLTLTGGLPFFGGAGNNYSMHAVAEMVHRCRAEPGSYGLVGANGGFLSKYSAGVYSTSPAPWRADRSAELQAEIDSWAPTRGAANADGLAHIETFTTSFDGADMRTGVVIGRLDADGARFVAKVRQEDTDMFELLASEQPAGQPVYVSSSAGGNWVSQSAKRGS